MVMKEIGAKLDRLIGQFSHLIIKFSHGNRYRNPTTPIILLTPTKKIKEA